MLELIDFPEIVQGTLLLAEVVSDAGPESPAAQEFWSLSGIFTLGMLILLQAVLGFDNLLYISIESKRVPAEKQSMVRRWGIGLAIAFRIVLLFVVVTLIQRLQTPFFETGDSDLIAMS